MANYTRLGSYLLASELTADPIGRIHRGIVTVGGNFDRHVLVRTFFEEILGAGFAAKLPDAAKALPQLGGSKAFGTNYRIESANPPHVVCDYVPGRSLAQLLDKAKHEQIPFGVDHALSVLQGIAQGVIQIQGKGLSHGLLSTHSVWVSFEGAAQILDVPFAPILQGMMAKLPVTQTSLQSYLKAGAAPLQHDFHGLGAILYEMLTLERLPTMGDPTPFVQRATLKAAQEEAPVPPEIQNLMMRLLGLAQPFETVGAFNTELERVLYDGDYSPTTFNMAFFMHTLFREENDKDGTGVKSEQADNYTAYAMVASGEGRSGGGEHAVDFAQEEVKSKNKVILFGGAAAAVVIAGLLFVALKPKGESEEVKKMRETLALMQQKQAEEEANATKASAALSGAANAIKAKQEELKLKQETAGAVERAKIQEQIDAEKKKQADIERQQKELEDKRKQREKEMRDAQEKIAKAIPSAQPPPPVARPVETPRPTAPAPATQPPPTPAPTPAVAQPPAPTPATTTPAPASASPVVVEETQVRISSQAQPVFPARAMQARWESSKSHTVRLRVFVDANGKPQKVSVSQGVPGPWGFDESATDAAMRSSYTPATRDGKPVSSWLDYSVTFQAQFRR